MMETLLQDIRYGFRMLLKSPGFTVIAIVALALGIGANSAIFSVVNAVLLRPLPYKDADRLVMLWEKNPQYGRMNVAGENWREWQKRSQSFEDTTLFADSDFNLTGEGEPERIAGTTATASFFSVIGQRVALGRAFIAGDDTPNAQRVVVLSDGLWQRRFGKDAGIIGKTMSINGQSYTIVGVLPPDFTAQAELWVPFVIDATQAIPGGRSLMAMGRLKKGITLAQAQSEMDNVARSLEQERPEFNKGYGVTLVPLYEQVVATSRRTLLILLGAVAFVLLIACANVANLLLARSARRRKEIAIRTAMGASRLRIIRQLLTESWLLAAIGGTLGLLLAMWGVDLLLALSPATLPRKSEIGVDANVFLFTLGISFLTGTFFGLAPALQHSRPDLNESLKEGLRASASGFGRRSLRSALVVAEVALALVLLIGAGLLMRSFVELLKVDPGFHPDHVLTMQIPLAESKYGDDDRVRAFYDQMLQRMRELPGVVSAGTTHALPFSGMDSFRPFFVAGRPLPEPGKETAANYRVISSDYFRSLGIPVLQGREFGAEDGPASQGVAIINQTLARKFFPEGNALGQQIRQGTVDGQTPWMTIVGIIGDVRHSGFDSDPRPEMYFPYSQVAAQQSTSISRNSRRFTLVVRTAGEPATLADAVRREILAVDKDQPVALVRTMDDYLSRSVAPQRFNMMLLTIFASVALLLAAVGIYGVMAYSVAQRTHEIGIRMALGAEARDVLRMIIREGMTLVLAGIGIGLVSAFALTRVMSKLLFGVSVTDPLTFAGLSLLLAIVALIACSVPARRATRVDPMIALRYE